MSGPSEQDVSRVSQILAAALSQNPNERQQAEAALTELGKQQGYCTCLIAVLQHGGIEISTKWLAAVQLKNTIARWVTHTRGPSSNAISDAEKDHVRASILQLVGLADQKLAVHVAVSIARIARHDYPAKWPSLFQQLTVPIANNAADGLTRRRIWLTLHHIIKELSTKRLPADRRRLRELAEQLLPVVWDTWLSGAQSVAQTLEQLAGVGGSDNGSEAASTFETWMLVTKVLRRLIMNGLQRYALQHFQRTQCRPKLVSTHLAFCARLLCTLQSQTHHGHFESRLSTLCLQRHRHIGAQPMALQRTAQHESSARFPAKCAACHAPRRQSPRCNGRCSSAQAAETALHGAAESPVGVAHSRGASWGRRRTGCGHGCCDQEWLRGAELGPDCGKGHGDHCASVHKPCISVQARVRHAGAPGQLAVVFTLTLHRSPDRLSQAATDVWHAAARCIVSVSSA